jgi:phosphohistidine phosphatase
MRLYLMRHGPAEDRAASGRDFDRPLSPAGRSVVRAVAAELHRLRGASLPRIVASPLLRAQQTAALVRDIAASPAVRVEAREELAAETPAFDLVAELASCGTDVLVVGHQPTIESLARGLADEPLVLTGYSTALVVVLEATAGAVAPGAWRAERVIDPRRLDEVPRS